LDGMAAVEQSHRRNGAAPARAAPVRAHDPKCEVPGGVQALLATGLLQLRPFRPRTTAVFGVLASALNVYMLAPPLLRVAKPAPLAPIKQA
jgi:hypothetical protein